MEERMRFVIRLLDGEAMSDVCREFGISRKTVNRPAIVTPVLG
jgi:transposase-like protein